MLVLGAGVTAQEAVFGLRWPGEETPLLRPSGSAPAGALGTRGGPGAEPGGEARRPQRPNRQARRRDRPLTSLPVQAGVRAVALSPGVTREVRPLAGPEPAPVLPRLCRRTLEPEAEPSAPPPLRGRILEPDPYAQVGYRVGNVALFPAIEQSIGYDSNPNRISGAKKGSAVLRTDGELRIQSDWSRHELSGILRGAYSDYPSVKSADRPEGSGRLNLRLDAARDTRIDLETRYLIDTQRPGSPELNAPTVKNRPLVSSVGASAGVTQRFNRVILGLRGNVDRVAYDDARLTDGTVLDQSDRDRTQYDARLRAGYELKPGWVPFVEGIADTRVFDRRVDDAGLRRSSDGRGVRAGSSFEITPVLAGVAAAGYMTRDYEDVRLSELRGPIADGALIWAPTPLTTVRLRGTAEMGDTSIAESNGVLFRRATVEVQHDLRRNLSLIGAVTVAEADYRGIDLHEEGFEGSVKLDYRLTRSVALRASFTHERLKSTDSGSDYTANVYLVGLRFQP
jgi:hypothetical protein